MSRSFSTKRRLVADRVDEVMLEVAAVGRARLTPDLELDVGEMPGVAGLG
jgi:hypothetical protein